MTFGVEWTNRARGLAMWYVGIDLGRKSLCLAATNDRGEVRGPDFFDCRDTEAILEQFSTLIVVVFLFRHFWVSKCKSKVPNSMLIIGFPGRVIGLRGNGFDP
jgi:hypothetical protein